MDCEHAISLISARLDHEIAPSDHAGLELHLKDCASCRATAEAFALQDHDLRESFEPRRRAVGVIATQVKGELASGGCKAPAAVNQARKTARSRRMSVVIGVISGALAASLPFLLYFGLQGIPQSPRPLLEGFPPTPRPAGAGDVLALKGELAPRQRPADPPPTRIAVGETVQTKPGERRRVSLPDGSILYVNQNTTAHLDAERSVKLDRGEVFVEVAPHGAEDVFVVKAPGRDVKALGTKFEVRADGDKTGVVVTQGKVQVSGLSDTLQAGQALGIDGRVEPAARASHLLDWARDLMAAAESPLVPASAYAGGSLIAVDSNGQEAKLGLRRYTVDVHIEDGFARTTIDQTYFNQHPWRLEGTFFFPLPPDASLSRLAMYVSDNNENHLQEGGMAERSHARQVYDRIVNNQRDPALLEWVDGSTFKMRVFPLEGRQEKRIILSYTQRLPGLYGRSQYRFPAGHSIQTVREWNFHAVVKGGANLAVSSPTHPLVKSETQGDDLVLTDRATEARVDKDVVLDIGERRGVSPPVELPAAEAPAGSRRAAPPRFVRAELDGQHYLAMRYRPELASQTQRQRRDWVFLFESSADRDPLLARTQIEIIRHLLTNAEHDDTFAIVTAGTRTHVFRDEAVPATPENVAAAVQFLEQTHLIGALDLGRAFRTVTPLLQRGGNPHLVHLGSGMAAIGTKQDAMAKLLPAGIRYVGIGVGKRWNRAFMKEQAEKTGGFFTQINPDETVSWRAFDLLATLNTPRLLDVKVMADSGSQAAPRFLVDVTMLAQGEELFAAARLADRDHLPQVVTVTGTLDGKLFREELPVKDVTDGAGYLPRTWAKLELDRLLSEYRGQQERRDEIVALSKAMYVMTPFTSLLVLENDAMYEEFKVDRGRKDHWAMYPCPPKTPLVYEPLATEIDARNAPTGLKPRANQVRPTIITRTPSRWVRVPGENRTDRWSDEAPGIVEERKKVEWSLGLPLSDPRRDPLDEFFVNLNEANTGSLMFGVGVNSDRGLLGSITLGDRAPMSKMDRADLDADKRGLEVTMGYIGRAVKHDRGPLFPEIDEQKAELLNTSEDLRHVNSEWERAWFQNGPSHLTYDRIQGGLDREPPPARVPEFRMVPYAAVDINGGDLQVPQLLAVDFAFRGANSESATAQIDSFGGSAPGLGDLYSLGVGRSSGEEPRLTYDRFSFTNDGRLFNDLVSYAPGLNTSRADVLAVLDAEAAPELRAAPGRVDPEAAALIDKARRAGWQTITLGAGKDKPGIVLAFDGAGRYVYERLVSFGLHERVVCDGKTLLHLYPEIGLGARRTMSRFHRMELAHLVPWWLPPVGDLARGQDVLWSKERPNAIALVPAGLRERVGARSETMPQQRAIRYLQTVLIFAEDGRLAERQLVEMPANKVHVREIYDGKGGVSIIDGKDKELFSSKRELKPASEPELNPDLASLVVLPLPYRSRQHTFAVADLDPSQSLTSEVNGCHPYLKHEKIMALLATLLAEQKSDDALELVRTHFLDRGDRRPGLFSLLAACGADLGGEMAFDKLLADSPGSPLIRYLALGASNGYRVIRNRMPVNLGTAVAPKDTFLGRLAIARDLAGRWNEDVPWWLRSAERRVDSARTLAFVHDNRDSVLGWALLVCMQQVRSADYIGMAQAWDELGGPDKDFRAQYERACCLADAGRKMEARKLFQDLYARALKAGVLPPIDRRFTGALLGEIQNDDEWTPLIRRTAADFINKKQRVAVVYLAWQCRQLRDPALAENLLELALEGIGDDAERLAVHGAALDYLWQARQYDRADALLRGLLENEKWQKAPALWRLAARFAEQRGQEDRSIACLERALDLEFQHLPEVIDLQSWRRDYGKLLAYYRENAKKTAAAGTDVSSTAELIARTVRAVDRWRAHDPESAEACKTAGEVLRILGRTELAWEYYTTPTAVQPERAMSEGSLSTHFAEKGDHGLAELAFELATDADPTDPRIVWDRAQNLRQAGRKEEAEHWLRKLVNDPGKDSWEWRRVRERAQWELERQ